MVQEAGPHGDGRPNFSAGQRGRRLRVAQDGHREQAQPHGLVACHDAGDAVHGLRPQRAQLRVDFAAVALPLQLDQGRHGLDYALRAAHQVSTLLQSTRVQR